MGAGAASAISSADFRTDRPPDEPTKGLRLQMHPFCAIEFELIDTETYVLI